MQKFAEISTLGGRAPCRGGGSLTISCRGGLCEKTGSWGLLEVGRRVEGEGSLLFLAEEAFVNKREGRETWGSAGGEQRRQGGRKEADFI